MNLPRRRLINNSTKIIYDDTGARPSLMRHAEGPSHSLQAIYKWHVDSRAFEPRIFTQVCAAAKKRVRQLRPREGMARSINPDGSPTSGGGVLGGSNGLTTPRGTV